MRRHEIRHYTEEELLMHLLSEETADIGREISGHLKECDECGAISKEYGDLVGRIRSWTVPEVGEAVWQTQNVALLTQFRRDFERGRGKSMIATLQQSLSTVWNYALENPLPTLGYIAVAIAFAMERTISTFRLDRILPGASQVYEILRQVF